MQITHSELCITLFSVWILTIHISKETSTFVKLKNPTNAWFHDTCRHDTELRNRTENTAFSFTFPSPTHGHTHSAQVDLLFCRLSKNYAASSTCASWVQLCIFPIKESSGEFYIFQNVCFHILWWVIRCSSFDSVCLRVTGFLCEIHRLKLTQPFG